MTDLTVIAQFPFVTNKSFGGVHRAITIPARFHQGLKEAGLTDVVRAKVNFRGSPAIDGSIRAGMRAGGRYYQITVSKPKFTDPTQVDIGTTLVVRVMKAAEDWLIEIA